MLDAMYKGKLKFLAQQEQENNIYDEKILGSNMDKTYDKKQHRKSLFLESKKAKKLKPKFFRHFFHC